MSNIHPENQKLDDKSNPKTMTQQLFHKGMFINRPRSSSFSGSTNQRNTDLVDKTTEESESEEQLFTEVYYGKRQRSSPDALIRNQKQAKLNYWLATPAVPTSNRFKALDDIEQADKSETQAPKPIRPPPLFIDGVKNIQPLMKLLEDVAKEDYEIKVLRGDRVKIQPKSAEAYSTIYKELKAKDTEFYSYQPKQDRSFRVVLKNLHPSTDKEDIKIAIEELHHKVVNVWNIQNSKTKQALSMWNIELEPRENNKDIYNVKYLLHCRISFEAPRPRRVIPQCTNCQDYNHTQKFCNRKPRCVKCAGSHHTSACLRKERSKEVKCILCEGNHPANYKGCTVYKELLKVRYPAPITRVRKNPGHTRKEQEPTNKMSLNRKSYAEATKEATKQPMTQTSETSELKTITETLVNLMNQMLIMTQTLTNLISKMSSHSQH
ncbi:unnamed protein product [Colias eurytheme]|nr:unnamed protein product [Colias eurytheme]